MPAHAQWLAGELMAAPPCEVYITSVTDCKMKLGCGVLPRDDVTLHTEHTADCCTSEVHAALLIAWACLSQWLERNQKELFPP